jgi:putative ABC transport system permease protein
VSSLGPVRTASGGIFRHKVQAFVLCMVLLVSTASATLGLALLEANNGPFNHAFARQNGADVTIAVNALQVTAAELSATAHASGVTAAAGPFPQVPVPVDYQGQPFDTLNVVGRSSPSTPVDTLVLTAGHWADGPGQLVMEGAPADFQGGPQVGGTFQATALPGKPVLTIVGFANSITHSAQAWVTPAEEATLHAAVAKAAATNGSISAAAGVYVKGAKPAGPTGAHPRGGTVKAGGPGTVVVYAPPMDQMLYRFTSAATAAQIGADVAAVTKGLPARAILSSSNWLADQQSSGGNSAIMEPFVVAFALIGLIMSVLIVANVVSGAVISQYHRIGVLKSLGMTPGQVIAVYLSRIGWPALAGCVIGVLLGNVLAIPVLHKSAGAYGVGQQQVPVWASIAAPVGMLVLTMLAAFGPALRAGRLSATEAIAAGRAPRSGRGYAAHRLAAKLRLPRPVSLGLAAPFARPGRTLVTLAAVAFGATAVIFAIGLSASLDRAAAAQSQSATVPVQIQQTGSGTGPGPNQPPTQAQDDAVTAALRAQPGTAHQVELYGGPVTVPAIAQRVQAQVFDGDSSWQGFALITGRWYSGTGEVDVNTSFLDDSGLSVGDSTTVNTGTASVTVKVVGEIFGPSSQPHVYGSTRTLPGLATPDSLWQWNVGLKPGTSASGYIQAVNSVLGTSSPWAAITAEHGGQFYVIAIALIGLLSLMVAVAAGLGVLNTVLMTTRDRVHDLGIFKALGMRPGQVVTMVTCWVVGPAIIAAVLAAPAAVALNSATLHAMASTAHTGIPASFTDVFPVPKLAVLSLAALVLAAAGAFLPASWAARARPAVALRAE